MIFDRAPSYEYFFGWLHARFSSRPWGEKLVALIQHGSIDILRRQLEEDGINVASRTEVQKLLTIKMLEELFHIYRLLDSKMGEFYEVYAGRYLLGNLKLVLSGYLQLESWPDLIALMVPSQFWPWFDFTKLDQLRSDSELLEWITPRYRPMLGQILLQLKTNKNLFWAENILDKLYYEEWFRITTRLPIIVKKPALFLCQLWIDIENILRCLRNLTVYRLEVKEMAEYLIPNGKLPLSILIEGLKQGYRKGFLNSLTKEWQSFLGPIIEQEIFLIESAVWNRLFDYAIHFFSDFQSPAYSVVVYPFLLDVEKMNLARLYEGYHFQLSSDDLKPLVIRGRK